MASSVTGWLPITATTAKTCTARPSKGTDMTRHQRLQQSMRSPQRAHHQRKKRDRQLTRALVTQGVITACTTAIQAIQAIDATRISRAELDSVFSHQSPQDKPFRSAKPTPWWHTWLPEKARRAREERQP